MGAGWDPLGGLRNAADEAYESFVDPLVEEAEEFVNSGAELLQALGEVVGDNLGDVLAAAGLDPQQLADDWQTLTDAELQSILDFLVSVGELNAAMLTLESLLTQARAAYNLSLQEKMTAPVMAKFVALKDGILTLNDILGNVLEGLRALIELLPGRGIEPAVNAVDPRFADWLQGRGLPPL